MAYNKNFDLDQYRLSVVDPGLLIITDRCREIIKQLGSALVAIAVVERRLI